MPSKHVDHIQKGSDISTSESIFCGAVAGLVSRFAIAPLDVIKIRIQIQPNRHTIKEGSLFWSTLSETVKTEGIRALWKGNVSAELMYLIYGSSQFTTYKVANSYLSQYQHLPNYAVTIGAGSFASTTSVLMTYPLDLLRTRFAAQGMRSPSIYTSLAQAVKKITATEGYSGLVRGIYPTLAAVVPNSTFFFLAYEISRKSLENAHIGQIAPEATAGFIAGIVSKIIVFPLDVVRKRAQLQGPSLASYGHGDTPVYTNSIIKSVRQICVSEGIRGLYKGLLISLVKGAPASAITMWTYERSLNMLRAAKSTIALD